jgi:hypothetical protein
MSKGAFIVSQDPKNSRDILFQLATDFQGDIPTAQMALREEIERTLGVLGILFPQSEGRFNEYFRQLLSLAQSGLEGEEPQPKLAASALNVLRENITAREGPRVKTRYLNNLGTMGLLIGAFPLIGALVIPCLWPGSAVLPHFLYLWVGSMVGVWLSFAIRKREMKFRGSPVHRARSSRRRCAFVFCRRHDRGDRVVDFDKVDRHSIGEPGFFAIPEQRRSRIAAGDAVRTLRTRAFHEGSG